MNSVRLWVLLLTTVSFLAGGAGGLLVGLGMAPPESGSFAADEERFAREFDLNAKQRRLLRMALREYHDELEELKARGVADLEEDLIRIGKDCKERIREYVLPLDRREEFDSKVAGMWPLDDSPSDP